MLANPKTSPEARAQLEKFFNDAPKAEAFMYAAFTDLNSERVNGMGVGPIPLRAMEWYGERYGLSSYDLEEFIWIIKIVDRHFRGVIVPMIMKRSQG